MSLTGDEDAAREVMEAIRAAARAVSELAGEGSPATYGAVAQQWAETARSLSEAYKAFGY